MFRQIGPWKGSSAMVHDGLRGSIKWKDSPSSFMPSDPEDTPCKPPISLCYLKQSSTGFRLRLYILRFGVASSRVPISYSTSRPTTSDHLRPKENPNLKKTENLVGNGRNGNPHTLHTDPCALRRESGVPPVSCKEVPKVTDRL